MNNKKDDDTSASLDNVESEKRDIGIENVDNRKDTTTTSSYGATAVGKKDRAHAQQEHHDDGHHRKPASESKNERKLPTDVEIGVDSLDEEAGSHCLDSGTERLQPPHEVEEMPSTMSQVPSMLDHVNLGNLDHHQDHLMFDNVPPPIYDEDAGSQSHFSGVEHSPPTRTAEDGTGLEGGGVRMTVPAIEGEATVEDVEAVGDTNPHRDNATVSVEVVRPAVLVLTPEQARQQMLNDAVLATNVRVIRTKRQHGHGSWKKLLLCALVIIITVTVGLSIGITALARKDIDDSSTSMSPTMAPTSARFRQVATLVESLFNTTMTNSSSPQYQAAEWMANVDEAFDDFSVVNHERFQQRYALVVFYFATGGPTTWIDSSFFLQHNVHECNWRNMARNDAQSWSGFIGVYNCSLDSRVERIEINQNNLTGTLPRELGSLSSLVELTVFGNSIGGTLPPSLFNLSHLTTFNVWSNDIAGKIPTEVGRATALQILVLLDNSLTSTIPAETGNLSNLQELSLGANFLTGTIPEALLRLSDTPFLEFGLNALTGTLPASLWLELPSLTNFGVLENLLSGTIPNNLDSLSSLTMLVLSGNNFTGPFPSSIVALSNVIDFSVWDNDISGTLPEDWNNLSQTLVWLQVAINRMTGTLPQSLGNLTNLEVLSVFENEFNGTLPSSLSNLTKAQGLEFADNHFTGTVPRGFELLTSLQRLTVHSNDLTGDLKFLCNGTDMILPYMTHLYADCLQEVECPCCNSCE